MAISSAAEASACWITSRVIGSTSATARLQYEVPVPVAVHLHPGRHDRGGVVLVDQERPGPHPLQRAPRDDGHFGESELLAEIGPPARRRRLVPAHRPQYAALTAPGLAEQSHGGDLDRRTRLGPVPVETGVLFLEGRPPARQPAG